MRWTKPDLMPATSPGVNHVPDLMPAISHEHS